MKSKCWIIVLLLWIAWGVPIPAHAHRVNIFAWVEGDTVFTQSKFGGGRKAMNALVEVYDDEENKLLEGRTDDNGDFSFKIPKRSALKIVLVAGTGHRGEWLVPLEEIAAADAPGATAAGTPPPPPVQPAPENAPAPVVVATPPQLDEAMVKRIESAVEKAVERKLHPVTRMLAESMNKGPSFKDILGGIGYILGLVGIAAYVQSRKEKRR